MQAYLELFCLDEMRYSGYEDPLAALILCGANRAICVMVSGKWLVVDGKAQHIDEAYLIYRHCKAAQKLRRMAGMKA